MNRGGRQLRRERKKKNQTQADVARELGLRESSSVAKWESGKRRPGRSNAAIIFKKYGIPVPAWDDDEEPERAAG